MPVPRLLTTSQIKTANVTDSSASVTISTLTDNTVYQLTNSALTALSITGLATGFEQAAITFTSGSTATTFSVPSDGGTASTTWRCVGEDTSNGSFVPVADKRYNLAIYQEADRVAIYVMDATA